MHADITTAGVHAGLRFRRSSGLALSAQAGEGRLSKILKAGGLLTRAAGGGDSV